MLRAEVEAIAAAASAAGRADRRRRHQGRRARPRRPACTSAPTGVGRRDPRAALSPAALRPGDRILVSGPIGDHGTAIMLARGEFELDAEIESDTRSLWPAVDALLERRRPGPALPARRDARRRRLGAQRARARLGRGDARRARRPCRCDPAVAGAAEILGIDPMYVANEGVLVAVVAPERRGRGAGRAARRVPGGEQAAVIGEVKTEPPGMVLVETAFGGKRVMDQLVGDPLPRIC